MQLAIVLTLPEKKQRMLIAGAELRHHHLLPLH